jgi:WD40 repeat protein
VTNALFDSIPISYANAVAFSPDGTFLAAGSHSGVVFYDLETLSETGLLDQGDISLRNVMFSPRGNLLAMRGYSYIENPNRPYVSVWDISTQTEILYIPSYQTDFSDGLAFSPDSTLLAFSRQYNSIYSQNMEALVHVLNISTGIELFILRLPNQEGSISSLAFSPDGTVLATASGNDIVLWSIETGNQLNILTGHTASINSIAFSPDGTILASASADGTIRLWGVESP